MVSINEKSTHDYLLQIEKPKKYKKNYVLMLDFQIIYHQKS